MTLNPKRRTNNTNLKKYIFKFEIKKKVCEKCGLGEVWQESEIIHQLEHKNGNKLDNRLENLLLLCPNCHSQTQPMLVERIKDILEILDSLINKLNHLKDLYIKINIFTR